MVSMCSGSIKKLRRCRPGVIFADRALLCLHTEIETFGQSIVLGV